jgi:radical SAM-linked protein
MKFISHLDLMRYVQKAFRRAGVDVAYSQGYNPHQILSFAAPLGLGDTSEGDYFDLQVNSMGDEESFLKKINEQMDEGIRLLSVEVQDEKVKPSMALVAAADYCVNLRDGYDIAVEKFSEFMAQEEIWIVKKSKRTEKEVDIRPMIITWAVDMEGFQEKQKEREEPVCPGQRIFEDGLKPVCYLRLDCGSSSNLKPDLVMEAFCKWLGMEYQPFAFQIHRLETYADAAEDENGRVLVSLENYH